VSQVVSGDTGPAAEPPQVAAAPRRGILGKTARDMVYSLLVIVALVVGLVLLVPRPNAVVRPAVDVASAASAAGQELSFTPSVPRGLPSGWSSTNARVERDSAQVMTWRVGYTTPSGRFAGFLQAAAPPLRWENAQAADGAVTGSTVIDGRTWITRRREDRGISTLVLRGTRVTTVVTGRATPAEIETLVRSLPLP
jgi:hypothetical protein